MTELLCGRYEVVRTISEGPRATLFQGLDRIHGNRVALKVFHGATGSEDSLLAEGRVLMNIAPHPSLPAVRNDCFTDDGRYVLVINWIEGRDLQQVLEDEGGAIPLEEVLEHLAPVAEALDHLHRHVPPVVHGDVKPANILLAPNGHVVLVDFDVAGRGDEGSRLGTPGFVAPEVVAGEKPEPAADVYGLAATAFALLNGYPPGTRRSGVGAEFTDRAQVASTLRNALSTDPFKRPRSAGRLIDRLRAATQAELPHGVVALLAIDVDGASHYWDDAHDEMHAAMGRLRDLRNDVVREFEGHIVTSMLEGDRVIVAFREPSAAAFCALTLHDRVAEEAFPPGVRVRLCAAIAAGRVTLADGAYSGAVVNQLLHLRAIAAPCSTLASEPTAELLTESVGSQMMVVSLGEPTVVGLRPGSRVFAVVRPGAQPPTIVSSPEQRVSDTPTTPVATPVASATPAQPALRRGELLGKAVQEPIALLGLLIAGFGVIYRLVLAPELGFRWLGAAGIAAGGIVAAWAIAWSYHSGVSAWKERQAEDRQRHDEEDRQRALARERQQTRDQLAHGFANVASNAAQQAAAVVEALADEYDAIAVIFARSRETSLSADTVLRDLIDEAYRHGMSALSDALELYETAGSPRRRRLQEELDEIEARLEEDKYPDDRVRGQDKERCSSRRALLMRYTESAGLADDLKFEADRCATALATARLDIASAKAGDARMHADAVVQTLEQTIERVRRLQEEFRRLGH